jgi:uncharacterized LabA/DUF88 family protein
MRRIAVFVDGSNFFYLQKDCLRWWIDPKKLLKWIATQGQVVDATYYASVDPSNEAQNSYIKALCHMGFRVESKIIKSYTQTDGSQKHKANLDVEIVLDMFNTIDSYDEAMLVSGDADFMRPLQILRARGKHFSVLSTKGFVASEIRQIAGLHYKDLIELRELIEKD